VPLPPQLPPPPLAPFPFSFWLSINPLAPAALHARLGLSFALLLLPLAYGLPWPCFSTLPPGGALLKKSHEHEPHQAENTNFESRISDRNWYCHAMNITFMA
jgi:hypothetical protein